MIINKLILSLFLFGTLSLPAKAQTNVNEAKAAYLLAEESYGKGDYKITLGYLEEASEKLGNANAKILYLRILSERELANKDSAYHSKVSTSIKKFEQASDFKEFNEEKKIEITKIKLQLNKELIVKDSKDLQRHLIDEGLKAYALDHTDWPLGATLEELKTKHPNMFATGKKKQNAYGMLETDMGTVYTFFGIKTGVTSFYIKNGGVIGYLETLIDITNDDDNYSKGNEKTNIILEHLTRQLGTPPVSAPSPINDGQYITYSWQSGQRFIRLTKMCQSFSGMRMSKVSTFFYYPAN